MNCNLGFCCRRGLSAWPRQPFCNSLFLTMAASRVKTTSDDASIQRLLHGQPGRQAAVTVPTGKLPQSDSPPSPTEMPQLPEEQAARTTGCLPGMKTVVRVAASSAAVMCKNNCHPAKQCAQSVCVCVCDILRTLTARCMSDSLPS